MNFTRGIPPIIGQSVTTFCLVDLEFFKKIVGIHQKEVEVISRQQNRRPICSSQSSGVTRVGVTRCGNWWCHPTFFLQKSDDLLFSHRPQKFKSDDLFAIVTTPTLSAPSFKWSQIQSQKCTLSSRCHPLDVVTRGGSPLPPSSPPCDATVQVQAWPRCIAMNLH